MAEAGVRSKQVAGPLESLEDWDKDLKRRYPETGRDPSSYRNYDKPVRPSVREFYKQNHRCQTLEFVLAKKAEYLPPRRRQMGIWEAMEFLNTLVDDSDPDTDLSQIEHLLQVAEAMRRDGKPGWFILTGLIHDLGKILCLWREQQWAVVGDTFPVGCAYSGKVVYPEFFQENPDFQNPALQTPCGIYEPGCGLDKVHLSWGHDEYLYQVTKDYLPAEALAMIRYHSFYAAHREGAYDHLMNDRDRELMGWVRAFNPYDLYTKGGVKPDVAALRPYYEGLIAEYFPTSLAW
jgi:inositol oxygenase